MSKARIWLCADDYGISAGVNLAIRDLVVRGRLNATSVLVAPPSCQRSEAIALAALNCASPRVAIGLHVALTAPFRPLSSSFEPLRDGAFMPLSATVKGAFRRGFRYAALAGEVKAQLQAFSHLFGRAPDFIDGHHHVHLLPQIRDAVLETATTAVPTPWLRQCGSVAPLTARLADRKGLFLDMLSRKFRNRAAALGLRTNPAFSGTYEFGDQVDFNALFPRFLNRMPDSSVIMCHPGFNDAELQQLDALTAQREREYAFLASDCFPAALAAQKISLRRLDPATGELVCSSQ